MSDPDALWRDIQRLDDWYEELIWEPEKPLEFKADYENDRIIITLKKD